MRKIVVLILAITINVFAYTEEELAGYEEQKLNLSVEPTTTPADEIRDKLVEDVNSLDAAELYFAIKDTFGDIDAIISLFSEVDPYIDEFSITDISDELAIGQFCTTDPIVIDPKDDTFLSNDSYGKIDISIESENGKIITTNAPEHPQFNIKENGDTTHAALYPYAHRPNGCSIPEKTLDLFTDVELDLINRDGATGFKSSCDEHDKCYYDTSKDVDTCNRDFTGRLKESCRIYAGNLIPNDVIEAAGTEIGQLIYAYYANEALAQEEACMNVTRKMLVPVIAFAETDGFGNPGYFNNTQTCQEHYNSGINEWKSHSDDIYDIWSQDIAAKLVPVMSLILN
jgi:hypothetical protein